MNATDKPDEHDSMKTLNQMAAEVHKANAKWWQNLDTGEPIKRNKGELLALVHSEVSEAYEGWIEELMDDKLPHRRMAEVEMADAFIRLLDFAAGFGHDLNSAALKVGVSAFLDLRHLAKSHRLNFGNTQCCLLGIHASVSRILECERKGKPEAVDCIVETILLVAVLCSKSHHDYDLDGAFKEKMAYNATRADHTHEARRIAGGKQF